MQQLWKPRTRWPRLPCLADFHVRLRKSITVGSTSTLLPHLRSRLHHAHPGCAVSQAFVVHGSRIAGWPWNPEAHQQGSYRLCGCSVAPLPSLSDASSSRSPARLTSTTHQQGSPARLISQQAMSMRWGASIASATTMTGNDHDIPNQRCQEDMSHSLVGSDRKQSWLTTTRSGNKDSKAWTGSGQTNDRLLGDRNMSSGGSNDSRLCHAPLCQVLGDSILHNQDAHRSG